MSNDLKFRATMEDKVSGPLDKMRSKFDTLGKTKGFQAVAQGVGIGVGINALGLLSKGIGTVTDFLGDSVTAYNDEQKSISALDASLRANISGWDGNRDAIEKVLSQRAKLAFSDDEQRTSLVGLVGATHDATKALEIQRTAMDLARFKGISLADASEALTKVEAGSYRILKSLGIVLKDGATQTDALTAVQSVAAGQAEAYAATNEGKLAVSYDRVHEAQERLGKSTSDLQVALAPVAATVITDFARDADKAAADWDRDTKSIGRAWQDLTGIFDSEAQKIERTDHRMLDNIEHMRGEISKNFAAAVASTEAFAKGLPVEIAQNLRGGWDDVSRASTALAEAMKNPIKAAAREKALQDTLDGKGSAGKRLEAGLKSADPLVREAARKLSETIQAELAGLKNVDLTMSVRYGKAGAGARKRASGGPVEAGGVYTVGEQGIETLVMGRGGGGYVIPHGGGGGDTHVTVMLDGDVVAEAVARRFSRQAHLSPRSGITGA